MHIYFYKNKDFISTCKHTLSTSKNNLIQNYAAKHFHLLQYFYILKTVYKNRIEIGVSAEASIIVSV